MTPSGKSWCVFVQAQPSPPLLGELLFEEKTELGWFVFWNLAVLCKTIPSFCPGSSALLGERITASKNVVGWFLDFYYFC